MLLSSQNRPTKDRLEKKLSAACCHPHLYPVSRGITWLYSILLSVDCYGFPSEMHDLGVHHCVASFVNESCISHTHTQWPIASYLIATLPNVHRRQSHPLIKQISLRCVALQVLLGIVIKSLTLHFNILLAHHAN